MVASVANVHKKTAADTLARQPFEAALTVRQRDTARAENMQGSGWALGPTGPISKLPARSLALAPAPDPSVAANPPPATATVGRGRRGDARPSVPALHRL